MDLKIVEEQDGQVLQIYSAVKISDEEAGLTHKSLDGELLRAGQIGTLIAQTLQGLGGQISFWELTPYQLTVRKTNSVSWHPHLHSRIVATLNQAIRERKQLKQRHKA
jgi:hypothetical protein